MKSEGTIQVLRSPLTQCVASRQVSEVGKGLKSFNFKTAQRDSPAQRAT